MKQLLYFVIAFSLFISCQEEDDDQNNDVSGPIGYPDKIDQDIQGSVEGQSFKANTAVLRYSYFDGNMTTKNIQSVNIDLFDTTMNGCFAATFPRTSPFFLIEVPPMVGIYDIRDYSFFDSPISSNGSYFTNARASQLISDRGYVEIEEIDTTGRGSITVYVYREYTVELQDANGSILGRYDNTIQGRLKSEMCPQFGRFGYKDQPMQGVVRGQNWMLDRGISQGLFATRYDLYFYNTSGADSCGTDPNSFPRFRISIMDSLGIKEYETGFGSTNRLGATYDTTSMFNAFNVQCGIKITEIDTLNNRIKGFADIFAFPFASYSYIEVNGRFDLPYCE